VGRHRPESRFLVLCALGLVTVVVGLLTAPAPYHRIVEHGQDDREFTSYVLKIMMIALLPFALSLGISLYNHVRQFGKSSQSRSYAICRLSFRRKLVELNHALKMALDIP
jgi:hypothetical protein